MEEKERKRKPRLKKRIQKRLILTLVPPIAERWMRWFNYTALKHNERQLTLLNHEDLFERVSSRTPTILALWHNRLMFAPTAYEYCQGRGVYVMISRSFDGELISKVLSRFKFAHAVRGGSARKAGQDKGGQEALARMAELGRQGFDLAITPDGPQGPCYKVKRGVIDLAAATNLPIYPIAASADKYLVAKSWDRTRLPLPYANFVYTAGEPMQVPPDPDEEMVEKKRHELETEMLKLTEYVDNYFGQKKKEETE